MTGLKHNGFHLLFVDDDPAILSALKRCFFEEGYVLHTATGGRQALAKMRKHPVAVALVDLKMPDMDGLALLEEIKTRYPDIQVIMLTGHGRIRDAVTALNLGALDVIEKPFVTGSLTGRVRQACQIHLLASENRKLKREIQNRAGREPMIGRSDPMLHLNALIRQVSRSDATVLIQGETGTGKELVARSIHRHSHRAGRDFVVVDCAAISDTLLESELFGHEKGAFTGAQCATRGLVRSAEQGTLFLDEIGELPLGLQAKLLRLIQEKEIRPLGSSRTATVDVRVIAATNRDLETETREKRFREDLYYRLQTVVLDVPPLRDRPGDVGLLATHFIQQLKTDTSRVKHLSSEALACLDRYPWPGNVRELENAIHRAMALGTGPVIQPQDLPPTLFHPLVSQTLPSEDSLAAYEQAAIVNALEKCGHNRKKAARMLGIGEATLYRKIKTYQIGRPA